MEPFIVSGFIAFVLVSPLMISFEEVQNVNMIEKL